MRVIFFGNGFEYSLSFMQALAEMSCVELVGIVSPVIGKQRRDWRRVASTLALVVPRMLLKNIPKGDAQFPILATAVKNKTGARLFWPDSVNDVKLMDRLIDLEPELVVMAGFNQILKPCVLDAMPSVINIHPSLLPDFRGPHPEFWTIAEGATESGVTLHLVDEGVDTGAIVAQESFEVEPWLTGGQLQSRAMAKGASLLERTLEEMDVSSLVGRAQSSEGTYFRKVQHEDLVVPFDASARVAFDRARAASPWTPLVAYVSLAWWSERRAGTSMVSDWPAPGLLRLEVSDALCFEDHSMGPPGTVRRVGKGVAISCDPGVVLFKTVG